MTAAVHAIPKAWIDEADLRIDDFRTQVLRTTDPADYPLASDVRSNVLVYASATIAAADRRALQAELIPGTGRRAGRGGLRGRVRCPGGGQGQRGVLHDHRRAARGR